MLKLSNPDLPTEPQGLVGGHGRLFQLYRDDEQRNGGGRLVILSKTTSFPGGAEAVLLGEPLTKGYFHRIDLLKTFDKLGISGKRKINRPSLLVGDSFWLNNLRLGIYSRTNLVGSLALAVIEIERYRALDSSADVIINLPDFSPLKVVSLGYTYTEGSGDDQWEYSDPVLTIHTTPASQIQPNQEVCIEGVVNVTIPPPTLQIISFSIEPDDAVLGIDLFGISFTLAFDKYNPKSGEFTVSDGGYLNLYVPMDINLPDIATSSQGGLLVNTGTLTYDRPVT